MTLFWDDLEFSMYSASYKSANDDDLWTLSLLLRLYYVFYLSIDPIS